ncbi:hypothetical protein [Neobacillus vireti]|uniref:DUF3953 domain-containing protein n=1 Tax=Neobacillus vireti LMG 21834 TaxID=1131730 RepID=A0AB94ITY3_9BACI|nr:hypothetical protein [Neobacillus vireti]ETI70540.1 hypothetical protein BAVI_02289 [Neobacillus vireti LMG 21834]KLT19943.1 hypothetical protein AA980_05210 [Neobacillus vireti]
MKWFSKLSVLFAIIGVLLFCSSYLFTELFEPLMTSGFGLLIVGSLLCFGAIFRSEKGKVKFLSLAALFLLSFIIVWSEPFQFVRLLTWMKN